VEGKVYLCRHKVTNERVAVKLVPRGIDAEDRQRLHREIQLQASLFHVNIAELKQVVLTRKHLGIVMEYVSGGTLWQFCSRWAPPSARRRPRTSPCWAPAPTAGASSLWPAGLCKGLLLQLLARDRRC
jgi:serine/threonine protein kinase